MRKNIETDHDIITGSPAAAAPAPVSLASDASTSSPTSGPVRRSWRSRLLGQLTGFGLVGGLAFVVDLTVYNLVRATVLDDSPIWSKVVSVSVATAVAWLGNRYLTFRRERSPHPLREAALFAVVNVVGLLIAAGCLFVSHYVLGFTSQLADNISGNGVGLVLGTAFRFVAYRWFVFAPRARTLRLPRTAHLSATAPTGGIS